MNNYLIRVNLKNASNPKMPVYMKVLEDLISHGPTSRVESVARVWHTDLTKHSDGWNCGPYTKLRCKGYAEYSRGRWNATASGKSFFKKARSKVANA